MLLYLYIGSTAYVLIDAITHQIYLDRRLKKEGYKFTNGKRFGLNDLVWGAFYLLILSIPVLNLISPLSHINKDRSYDEYKNYLDEAGAIELEEDTFLYQDNAIKNKNIIQVDNSKLMERINSNGHIYYSSVSKEETNELENGYTYKKILK